MSTSKDRTALGNEMSSWSWCLLNRSMPKSSRTEDKELTRPGYRFQSNRSSASYLGGGIMLVDPQS